MAVPGSVVNAGDLVTPGGAQGPLGPTAVSANTGNVATLGSDSLIYVPDPASEITSVRLRSFNAVGNPNFEVDQRNVGGSVNPANNVGIIDRWFGFKPAGTTMATGVGQLTPAQGILVPGTNFRISSKQFGGQLTTQQTTLAAGDFYGFVQHIEGSVLRELMSDVSSISLLAYAANGLKFSISIRDSPATKSLVKLCTIPPATWTLVSLPNLPVFPSGNFSAAPGVVGCDLAVILASGATFTAPAADTWQTGNFLGAPGMDNFGAQALNSTFYLGFVQHEPGPLCTTLIDKPFRQNYDECLRYYQKSYDYQTAVGTTTGANGTGVFTVSASNVTAFGQVGFQATMAKQPTMILYALDGTPNAVRATPQNSNWGITSCIPNSKAIGQISTATAFPANNQLLFHWTADTGW
jgi:hypothetical protein